MDTLQVIMEAIEKFGFPLVVAGWALWRLDRNWAKGEAIPSRLDQLEEGLDRIEMAMNKHAEIQQEMLLNIKIQNAVMTGKRPDGGDEG